MAQPESMKLVTKPTREPVTLEEAKAQLRLDHTDADVHINRLIIAARQWVENYTRQRIVRQKWRLYFKAFADEMYLQPANAREVDQVQYIDVDGNTQTAAASLYDVDVSGQRILRAYSQTWPSPRYQENAVWIDAWVGMYDETASPIDVVGDVDEPVKQAILMLVSSMYEQSENDIVGTIVAKPNVSVELLLQSYRMLHL